MFPSGSSPWRHSRGESFPAAMQAQVAWTWEWQQQLATLHVVSSSTIDTLLYPQYHPKRAHVKKLRCHPSKTTTSPCFEGDDSEVCMYLSVGIKGMKDRDCAWVEHQFVCLSAMDQLPLFLFQLLLAAENLPLNRGVARLAGGFIFLLHRDVIPTAEWNRPDSSCRRNVVDTSPDGDRWKSLTHWSETHLNVQSPALHCCS